MTMKVEPTGAATGARITGVDLSKELDPDVVASIHKAWKDHQVLIFPDQDLTENEQVRFARLWGEFPKRDRFEARPDTIVLRKGAPPAESVHPNGSRRTRHQSSHDSTLC